MRRRAGADRSGPLSAGRGPEALWALAWLGSTPIGGPIVGWIGQDAGARWALLAGGVATLLCGALALGWAASRANPATAAVTGDEMT